MLEPDVTIIAWLSMANEKWSGISSFSDPPAPGLSLIDWAQARGRLYRIVGASKQILLKLQHIYCVIQQLSLTKIYF